MARGGGDSEKVANSNSAGNDSNDDTGNEQATAKQELAADESQQSGEGAAAAAETSSAVAKIGDTEYTDLQSAFNAAKTNDIINVLADMDLGSSRLDISYSTKAKNVTVDFGGHKVTSSNQITLAANTAGWIFQNGTIENTALNSGYGALYISSAKPTSCFLRGGSNGLSIISKTNGIFVKTNGSSPTLTIENGVNVSGKIGVYLSGATGAPYRGQYSGTKTLNVDGGSINGTEAGVFVVGSITKNAKEYIVANISGGTITGGYYAVAGNGDSGHNGTEINISGGTLKSTSADGAGIYHPQKGTLNISGGAIEGAVGVQMCAGDLNVTGNPMIKGTGADATASKTGDGAICDGSAISIVDRGYPGGKPTAKVSSGTITSEQAAAVKAYGWSNNATTTYDNTSNEVAVSGGTFKAAAETAAVDSSLLAKGFELKNNEDGTITVGAVQVAKVGETEYTSLQEAINAADAGATVTLLADVDTTSEIRFDKDITVDFNGKKIENTADLWDTKNAEGKTVVSVISVKGNVTFKGNGKVVAKQDDCYAVNVLGGALTIEDGEYVGNISAVQVQAGTLAIKGGKFSQRQESSYGDTYLINCIDSAYKDGSANVAISGGTFAGFDPNVSPEQKVDGKVPSFAAPGAGITKNEDGSFTAAAGMTAQILDKDGNSVKAYNTLAEAVAAAEDGQTVTLLTDVEQNTQLTTDKSITLDLNGKIIKISGYTANKAQVSVKGDLTIQDSSEAQTGKICSDYTGTSGRVVSVENGGKLTIEGGTITTEGMSNSGSAVYIASGAEVNMTGGTVRVDAKRMNFAMNVKGSTGVFVMSGGSVIAEAGDGTETNITAISGSSSSTIQISAGTVSGPQAVLASRSATTITGGNFTGSIAVKNGSISGGTFTTEVPADYCADGFAPAKTTDASGKVTYGVASGLVNFWGGSLRMDKYENADGTFTTDEADLRFGFNFDLPKGAKRTAFGFDWGTIKSDLNRHVKGVNYRDAITQRLDTDPEGVKGTVSNLVITNIPKAYFGTMIYAQMWVTYELNGVSYTIHTDVQSRSVSDIATKIMNAGQTDSKEYKYASALLGLGED